MRVMVIVKADEHSEAGEMPSTGRRSRVPATPQGVRSGREQAELRSGAQLLDQLETDRATA